jgi:glycosyltransferase involved in cell wall biosynthesis
MKVVIALAGTDRGRSGLGVWIREVVPRLIAGVRHRGGSVRLVGTRADVEAYGLDAPATLLPSSLDAPAASAAFHMLGVAPLAARLGADVLLMPAANRRFALASPVPTVGVVHDLAPLRVRDKYDTFRTRYVQAIARHGFAHARSLVAVSRSTADDLAQLVGARDVRVVPNGVDAARFAPRATDDPDVRRARAAHALERPYVLYVSRLEHPGKNHLRLVRAFAATEAARDHDLVLVGGDWGAGPLIRAEASARGVGDRVRVLGHVDDALLPAIVAGADAVAMVGLREGFGLPALEALAAGRPVLAASTGALPEVVGDLGRLVDPLDERDLSLGLAAVLTDASLRCRAREDGPRWASHRDWGRTAQGVLEAVEEAA